MQVYKTIFAAKHLHLTRQQLLAVTSVQDMCEPSLAVLANVQRQAAICNSVGVGEWLRRCRVKTMESVLESHV